MNKSQISVYRPAFFAAATTFPEDLDLVVTADVTDLVATGMVEYRQWSPLIILHVGTVNIILST